MRKNSNFIRLLILALVLMSISGYILAQDTATATPEPGNTMSGMSDMDDMEMDLSVDEFAPLVRGLYNGDELFFIHTEASDPDVAEMLAVMMGPEVIVVPSLAEINEDILAHVYVFTNGISGMGPMGFQPDVFDSVPGNDDYSPLRTIHLVTWVGDATPRLLDNVEAIQVAEGAGELVIEQPGIVVNMPILVWSGETR
jgi:hypothetical protein